MIHWYTLDEYFLFPFSHSLQSTVFNDLMFTINITVYSTNYLLTGVNPKELRDTKTGVFVGACFSESEKTWFYEKMQVNGFGITG